MINAVSIFLHLLRVLHACYSSLSLWDDNLVVRLGEEAFNELLVFACVLPVVIATSDARPVERCYARIRASAALQRTSGLS